MRRNTIPPVVSATIAVMLAKPEMPLPALACPWVAFYTLHLPITLPTAYQCVIFSCGQQMFGEGSIRTLPCALQRLLVINFALPQVVDIKFTLDTCGLPSRQGSTFYRALHRPYISTYIYIHIYILPPFLLALWQLHVIGLIAVQTVNIIKCPLTQFLCYSLMVSLVAYCIFIYTIFCFILRTVKRCHPA